VRRAQDLSLRSDKLAAALGRQLPDVAAGLARFQALHKEGWPEKLHGMAGIK
jgi:hypothetical protein